MIRNMTAIILAGGRSRRFGSPKAMARWQGRTLIEEVISSLRPHFFRVVVMVKEPAEYAFLERIEGVRVMRDILRDYHPIGRIYAGLMACETDYAFVSACDTPRLEPNLPERLRDAAGGYDAVIPVWKSVPQTLRGIYRRSCVGPIEKMIAENRLCIQDLLRSVHTRFLPEEEVEQIDPEGLSFADIDTPEEHFRARETARRGFATHAD